MNGEMKAYMKEFQGQLVLEVTPLTVTTGVKLYELVTSKKIKTVPYEPDCTINTHGDFFSIMIPIEAKEEPVLRKPRKHGRGILKFENTNQKGTQFCQVCGAIRIWTEKYEAWVCPKCLNKGGRYAQRVIRTFMKKKIKDLSRTNGDLLELKVTSFYELFKDLKDVGYTGDWVYLKKSIRSYLKKICVKSRPCNKDKREKLFFVSADWVE